jgi:hypothetical protein
MLDKCIFSSRIQNQFAFLSMGYQTYIALLDSLETCFVFRVSK